MHQTSATGTVRQGVAELLAEGRLTPDAVISPHPIVLPPEMDSALAAGFKVRCRAEYPLRKNLLDFKVFLAAPGTPRSPLAELSDADERIFVHLLLEIDIARVSLHPEPALVLLGQVHAEPKMSPFFPNLSGRPAYVSMGFHQEGAGELRLMELGIAGDHAVFAREAHGIVRLQS